MKNFKIACVLFLAVLCFSSAAETKAQEVSVNFSLFQNTLNPYGRWINNPRYGQVWIYSDPGFRPYYTDGHWEYTNYGWSWVSDYDWGWAPFHYGRWEYDPLYGGWMWIPGYDWGAAWVSWSEYDGYYGWAPLGFGININVGFGSIPYDRWTFVPRGNICDRDIRRYYVSPERNYGFRHAVVINNYYEGNGRNGRFMRGPERSEVERYTHYSIPERRMDDREWRGNRFAENGNNRRNNDRNSNDNNAGIRRNNDQPVRIDNNNRSNQNFPGNRDVVDNNRRELPSANNNRQPSREFNNNAQQNNDRFQGNRENDNQVNRNNNRRENFPQRQQQFERPVRQQPAITGQRNAEHRGDFGNRQNEQRSNGNYRSQNANPGRGNRNHN